MNKQAPPYRIVICHYLFSALCFLAVAVMLGFSASDLYGHYFHPHLLATTHMAALGWACTVIFGACYQLLPVVFETGLYSTRLPAFSLAAFSAGTVMLVFSFWIFDPGMLMQMAAILVLTGITLFVTTVILTALNNKTTSNIYQDFIVTASVWLLATAILGLLLVFNFRYPFLPKDHLDFLKLHAHMGIGGWFLLLIIGVSGKLIPMFLVSKGNEKLLSFCYYFINASLLLFLFDTYINGLNAKTFAILGIGVIGLILYFVFVAKCFAGRLKKKIELPITNTIFSVTFLAAALLVLPVIIYLHITQDTRAVAFTNAYGLLLFMGWITALILGQAFKTLPFIVWAEKYEHLAGKMKTPLPADLYKSKLLGIQTGFYIGFILAFATGMIAQIKVLVYTGIAFLVITALAYLINLLLVILHKSTEESR